MSLLRLANAGLVAGLLLVAGCQSRGTTTERTTVTTLPPPAPTPVPQETIDRFHRQAPDAVIGKVTAADPAVSLVAVGNLEVQDKSGEIKSVPISDFRVGDSFVFYGSGDVMLGAGSVVNIINGALHVRYEEPSGHRAPTTGDIAIHFAR